MKKVEVNELYISDQLLDEIIQGELIETISFGEYAPKLNDILYGCPLSMVTMISAPSGCVDCETEFFNGSQWKKISDYQPGDKVLQCQRKRSHRKPQFLTDSNRRRALTFMEYGDH